MSFRVYFQTQLKIIFEFWVWIQNSKSTQLKIILKFWVWIQNSKSTKLEILISKLALAYRGVTNWAYPGQMFPVWHSLNYERVVHKAWAISPFVRFRLQRFQILCGSDSMPFQILCGSDSMRFQILCGSYSMWFQILCHSDSTRFQI